MINEFSGLYPFVISYCLKRDQDTWLAVGVCLMAFTRLLGVPFILKLVQHCNPLPILVLLFVKCMCVLADEPLRQNPRICGVSGHLRDQRRLDVLFPVYREPVPVPHHAWDSWVWVCGHGYGSEHHVVRHH
jgi:hypothetical protein